MFQNLHRSLPPGGVLRIECEGCGRKATWRRALAVQQLGPDATPADIRRRLYCATCGKVGRARVWI